MSEFSPELKIFIASGFQSENLTRPGTRGAELLQSLILSYGRNRVELLNPTSRNPRERAVVLLANASLIAAEVSDEDDHRDMLLLSIARNLELPILAFSALTTPPEIVGPLIDNPKFLYMSYSMGGLDERFREALRLVDAPNPFI